MSDLFPVIDVPKDAPLSLEFQRIPDDRMTDIAAGFALEMLWWARDRIRRIAEECR